MKKSAPTRISILLAVFVTLFGSVAASRAATESVLGANGKRPRICLVLSGGGARGAAHVGVIKVLEKYRVPVDCVAGTSMGSLVGGAYATGMSTTEMDKVLASISTELLFKDKPPRQERTMRSKQDDFTILFSPELGVKDDGIAVTKGLVSGVQLENVLRKLTKLSGYHNFDKLPIPYRAVATDLVTGKAVVFDKGDMVNAMRASMSVPGAIAPAEFNGMMLVDGMLTNNLPVEIARDILGADIIIAVNVGTPLLKREQLTTILGVSGQMLSILTEQNVQASLAKLKPTDILISPELDEFTTGDFNVLSKISPRGETAALKVASQLEKLSLPPAQYAALRKQQMTDLPPDLRPLDEIRIADTGIVNPASTLAVMETQTGLPLNQDKLDGDMRRIYGTGNFEHVGYKIVEEQSKRILVVDAVEKSWGPDYLRFGLGLASDFKGEAYYNLLASYRKTWINSLGAEWRTDVQMGQNSFIRSELYQPLSTNSTRLFVLPYVDAGQRMQSVYRGSERIAQLNHRHANVGFDVGSQFHSYGELRLGVATGELRSELRTGPAFLAPQPEKIGTGAIKARLAMDQLDSSIFPRQGWGAYAQVYNSQTALGADNPYTKWEGSLSSILSYGNHTFNFYGRAGGRWGSERIPSYDQFQWGGFLQQSGYAIGQLAGQDITFGRMMYYHRIMHNSLLEGAYAGFSLEAGKIGRPYQTQSPEGLLKSVSAFVGSDSPIGPVYLGYGHAASGPSSLYFFLGRPY